MLLGHIFAGELCYAEDMKFLSPNHKVITK